MIRLLPMLAMMGLIFLLSHQPADQLDLPTVPFLDKIGHFVVYGLLAWSVVFAFSASLRQSSPKRVALAAVLFSVLYGIGDEFHQSFIPGREVSPADIAADLGGAAAAIWLWWRRRPAGGARRR